METEILRQWQIGHYTDRLKSTDDPKAKMFLRSELHRLKKPGIGILIMPYVGSPLPVSIKVKVFGEKHSPVGPRAHGPSLDHL